ncbi:MAG: MotA/TolQ/ExbB proton channel family protein [Planctomycetota bacterium]
MPEIFLQLVELIERGTLPVMVPLIITCCAIGWLTVDRILYLYDPRIFVSVLPWVRAGMERDRKTMMRAFHAFLEDDTPATRRALEESCLRYRTPYSRFLLRMLANPVRRAEGVRRELQAERAELEEAISIEQGMSMLSTFARAAPLMGLMGTVTGMIATFSAMMSNASNDPKALSAGISIALTATNVGLVVSLPGVVSMGWLSKRGQTLQSEIRIASMQLRGSGLESETLRGAA